MDKDTKIINENIIDVGFDMNNFAKLADELRVYAVANCKTDRNQDRPVCEAKAANAIARLIKHLTFWLNKYKEQYDKQQTEIEMLKKDFISDIKVNGCSKIFRCENCKSLLASEITNRLFCSYHSEGEYQQEIYKDDYCSYFERK